MVIGIEMARKIIQTLPSALAGTAAGFGYSKDRPSLMSIAHLVRNRGYRAVASRNHGAQCIP